MEAAQILEEEHKIILTILNVLERLIAKVEGGTGFPASDAEDVLRFFVEFADKCHHAKEEDTLFPAMEANGFPSDAGPTAVMRHEHRVGRELVRAMQEALPAAVSGDLEAIQAFCARGRAFIELLEAHIRKEDHCLFPMACNAIRNPNHVCSLSKRFREIEAEAGGGRHREFLAAAAALCERYGVTPVVSSALPALTEAFLRDPA